ncbi:MAG: hypothetical protein AB1589_44515 [Cyanobacteriota bacterium]
MTPLATQQSKVGKISNPPRPSPNSRKYAEVRVREYLLPIEVESMRDAQYAEMRITMCLSTSCVTVSP